MPRLLCPRAAPKLARVFPAQAPGAAMLLLLVQASPGHSTWKIRQALLAAAILAGLAASPVYVVAQPGAPAGASDKVATRAESSAAAPSTGLPSGTYGIEGSADLEARGLYHFLYLHPGGRFLMAGEWAHNESSRAAGQWTVHGSEVTLTGSAHVQTNQGSWDVPFRRVFRWTGTAGQTRLEPEPEKNRFGMLGWPNAYKFKSPQPTPSIPGGKIPRDEPGLLALIGALVSTPTGTSR